MLPRDKHLFGVLWKTSHTKYLSLSLVVYLGLVGILLAASSGLPYVTDNNESFSMFVHANNMIRFGFWHGALLSDEAYGRQSEAHPYVYTHEGNFPRFFVYVLMRLGIIRIEWQIAITAVLVGSATIYLCFQFFSRSVSDLFAFIVCTVFATDYLLFMQWEVNTFRVWHGLLFFLCLVCVQEFGRRHPRRAGATLFFTAVALFYFEVVFALFAAAMSVCYALLTFPKRRLVLAAAAITSAGAGVAIACLFGQSVALLGWTAAARDVELTFLSRNFYHQATRGAQPLIFYLTHHIVYWLDQPNTSGYLHVETFLHTLGPAFRTDTPFFMLLAWILASAWGCRLGTRLKVLLRINGASNHRRPISARRDSHLDARGKRGAAVVGAALLGLAYAAVNVATRRGSKLADNSQTAAYAHIPGFPTDWLAAPDMALAVAAGLVVIILVVGALGEESFHGMLIWRRGMMLIDFGAVIRRGFVALAKVPGWSLAIAAFFLFGVKAYEIFHWHFYSPDMMTLWMGAITAFFPDRVLQAGMLGAVVLSLLFILDRGRQYLPLQADPSFLGALRYLVSGGIALLVVYVVFPGYLWNGYLSRYAPLPVFVVDVWVGLCFYVLATVAWASSRAVSLRWRRHTVKNVRAGMLGLFTGAHLVLVMSVSLLLFGIAYWARVQTVYIATLPPTSFSFARQLARPPYLGATIISNNYSAPLTYYTGTWAYEDPFVQENQYTTVDGQTEQVIAGYYLWEADGASNSDYRHPRYYVCIANPDLSVAAAVVALPPGGRLEQCSRQPLVRDAIKGSGRFHNVLVAKDPGPRDMWAIVRLDPTINFKMADRP
jgi:hypothetical protein